MTKIRLIHLPDDRTDGMYVAPDGSTIKRDETGESPNGNRFNGRWVLRDKDGAYLDHDQYRSDLMERHGFDDTPLTIAEYLAEEFA